MQTVQHKLVFAIHLMYGVHTKFFNLTMYVFVNKVTNEAIKGNIYIKKRDINPLQLTTQFTTQNLQAAAQHLEAPTPQMLDFTPPKCLRADL